MNIDVSYQVDEVVSLLDVAVSPEIIVVLRARKRLLERRLFEEAPVAPTERLDSTAWTMLRREALERDGYKCQGCTTFATLLNVHHIIPLSRGGRNDLSNLITLCDHCHAQIHPWLEAA